MADKAHLTDEQLDELIRHVLLEAQGVEFRQFMQSPAANEPLPEPSLRFKRRINHIFRSHAGSKSVPYPEVDTRLSRLFDRAVFVLRRLRRIAKKLQT